MKEDKDKLKDAIDMSIKKAFSSEHPLNLFNSINEAFATERVEKFIQEGDGALDLSNLMLTQLPNNFVDVVGLKILKISGNKLDKFPVELEKQGDLEIIDLSNNKIKDLPKSIGNPRLKKIFLNNNLISKFPIGFSFSKTVKSIDLSYNNIKAFPEDINPFRNIEELYLSNNKIKELPVNIGILDKLLVFNLENNQLGSLPPSIKNLNKLLSSHGLAISKDNFKIPPEIFEQEIEDIVNYILNEDKILLNEAKMLLLGDGNVGKTAIVNRLINNEFIEGTSMTRGINIRKWEVATQNNSSIKINIWDFGGQEIMHAMHQFFMTKRSLYLLLCNARENNNEKIEDWLKLIQAFGGNSPVILVVNRIDDGTFEPEIRRLKEKYSNIVAYIRTSCKKRIGIDELQKIIKSTIVTLPHLHDFIPEKWLKVKSAIEKIEENYISLDKYIEICRENNIHEFKDQMSLLRLLHDLGVAFNFGDMDNPTATNILKPEWVTKGIYDILNSNLLFNSKGQLSKKSLQKIFTDSSIYPPHKYDVILEIMQKFELCFKISNEDSYLIPDLLQTDQPPLGNEFQEGLKFQYTYDFLPQSIMPRFIIKSNLLSKDGWYWRNGIILTFDHNKALIKVDRIEKKIHVTITGSKTTSKPLLNKILQHFEEIHQTISNIDFKILISIPDNPRIHVNLDHLLTLERLGNYSFIPEGMTESINVLDVLHGFGRNEPIEKIISNSDNNSLVILMKEKEKKLNQLREKDFLLYQMASKHSNIIFLSIWSAVVVFAGILICAIFTFSWDIMEMYTYIIGISIAIIIGITRDKILPKNIANDAMLKKRMYLNIIHEFDEGDFNRLKHEVEALKIKINPL